MHARTPLFQDVTNSNTVLVVVEWLIIGGIVLVGIWWAHALNSAGGRQCLVLYLLLAHPPITQSPPPAVIRARS